MKILLIKFGLLLIVLAFVNYFIFALLGCLACVLGASENYYCTTYCWMIKTFSGLTFAMWVSWFAYSIIKLKKTS